jgi:precorrin-4/cobalt-precorrin-4 C11-methyltransferase
MIAKTEEEKMHSQKHPIIFCGAGPGDPELITVKGQKALQQADLVLYAGSLVPEAVLRWAPAGAQRISSAEMTLEQIVATMVQAFRQSRRVVRLHTGDPSLYGALFEQLAELRKLQIPCHVIPGVTAAFAAAAAMGLEYTLPEITQTLILTRMAGRTPVPEAECLGSLARHQASMAIYLSMAMVDQVTAVLAKTYGPRAGCLVAYKVSHPEEKMVMTTVADLAAEVRACGIDRHALIVVGPAVGRPQGRDGVRSNLYAAGFSHGYRRA